MRYSKSKQENETQYLWEHAIDCVEHATYSSNMYADEDERKEAYLDEVYTIAYLNICKQASDYFEDYLCKQLARDVLDLYK